MLISQPQLALGQWLCDRIGYTPTRDFMCIGQWDDDKNELIGVVGYDGWSENMVEMHSAGEPGTYWLTKELLYRAFKFPFEGYGMKAIISRVSTGNPVAVKMNIGLGFKEQCRIRDGADDGDLIIFAMHRDECRWLKMNSRYKEAA
jgi:RimJ/RimL family protein N-acetyltransferase